MLFNSFAFLLIFLPLTFAGFFLLGARHPRAAAAWLTLASLVFYACWDYRYLLLIVASIVWNFGAGVWMLRSADWRKPILLIAVVGDLALLGYYKYTGFFLELAAQTIGRTLHPVEIVLPLGISFFTFTQIAFLVDTARGQVRELDPIRYALFVTYFPHLIAGPILYHKEIIPRFAMLSTYRPHANHIAIGIAFFTIGLAKKCLIADSFASDAAAAFDVAAAGTPLSATTAWRGAIAYTLQLYFDFSGYCDMAIGLSRLFNVRLPLNFNSPYQAVSIIDFWRRWHMTLSRFLRDYLYIPLGGSRRGPWRTYINVLVTMLLCGLWHGAGWTFVAWGALHGMYLVINRAWLALKPAASLARIAIWARTAIAWTVTMLAVIIGWVIFRAADMPTAQRMFAAMLGANGFALPPPPAAYGDVDLFLLGLGYADAVQLKAVLLYAGALLIILFLPNTQQIVEPARYGGRMRRALQVPLRWSPSRMGAVACAIMMIAAMMTFARVSEFLYFQF